VVSLHYGSSTQDVNTWLAVQGLEPDDVALSAQDEIRAIKERRIATTIAQAIGRLRLRTMTNPDGTCEPCDVFLRLTNYKGIVDCDKIMAGVTSTLPGVRCVPWTKSSTKLNRPGKAPRERAAVVTRLLALADLVAADGVARELTEASLQTTNGTLHRVLDRAKDSKHQLYQDLAQRAVRLVSNYSRPPVLAKGDANVIPLTAVEATLVDALRALPAGTTRASTVQKATGISRGSWGGLIASPAVVQQMTSLRVTYQGGGKGAIATFTRA
jgi:hypothetical protein